MNGHINGPAQEIQKPDVKLLADLTIYLEGFYKGQGNILPLGKVHLENLWVVIKYLQGKSDVH